MRMFDLKTKIYLGKCLFSNMFSVPYKELEVVDITDFDEEKFVLMEKKLEYIKRNHDRIMKSAKMLFRQKSRNYKQSYLKSTVDFTKIENASLEWKYKSMGNIIIDFLIRISF